MSKKVVVLGGGSGLSTLLRGLKLFPLEITAVVAVSDDGGSTGKLREEFNIPSIGDIRQVLVSLSETGPLIEELLEYRFKSSGDLNNHPTGNLLLAALIQTTGNLSEAIKALSKVLNIKGKILPLSEDVVTLVSKTASGRTIEGEKNIEETNEYIKEVYYKEKIKVTKEVIEAIEEADLIVFSMGTLYASIVPNIIAPEIKAAIKKATAKKIVISNLMTEYGEKEKFKVSDFINTIHKHAGFKFLDAVIANNGEIDQSINKRYKDMDNSMPIILDIENLNIKVIEDNFVQILEEKDLHNIKRIDKMVRHNTTKLALSIYTYLMNEGD